MHVKLLRIQFLLSMRCTFAYIDWFICHSHTSLAKFVVLYIAVYLEYKNK